MKTIAGIEKGKLFDVGCGEGFFGSYFYEKSWEVKSCDFSSFAIKKFSPRLLDTFIEGNIFKIIKKEISKKNKYDLINLKNVLEHVINPIGLLKDLKNLMDNNSILLITVPNDSSKFQELLLQKELSGKTWFSPPDHLNYFNFETLVTLLESLNLSVKLIMTNFPIELYLLNKHSNYFKQKERGKEAHLARIMADNFMFKQGIQNYINFYCSCVNVNIGRSIIIYVPKN